MPTKKVQRARREYEPKNTVGAAALRHEVKLQSCDQTGARLLVAIERKDAGNEAVQLAFRDTVNVELAPGDRIVIEVEGNQP